MRLGTRPGACSGPAYARLSHRHGFRPPFNGAGCIATMRGIAQYDAHGSLPGYHVNGALTLGENVADNAGCRPHLA